MPTALTSIRPARSVRRSKEVVLHALESLNVDVYTYEIAHARMRARDEKRESDVALAVVVLSAVVGASVFASIATSPNIYAKVFAGCLSVLAAVLAAVNKWAPLTGASEHQRKAQKACGDLRTHVLEARNRVLIGMMTPKEGEAEWEKLRDRYKHATEGANTPAVSDRIYAAARETAEREANE